MHVGVSLGITLFPISRPRNVPSSGVAVRLLTREEFDAAVRPGTMSTPEKQLNAVPGTIPLVQPNVIPRSGAMVQATELFSADVLADKGSKQIRETLPLLAKADRIMQLCNIEAVEQIRRSGSELLPDYVVADATMEAKVHNSSVNADGGAFRSKGGWYRLKYHCIVTANLASVASFEFFVGEKIPRKAWAKLSLTAEGSSQD
jgi:hypothetical protein